MGVYDTLVDGDISGQLKCYGQTMQEYHPGDALPPLDTITPAPPTYSVAFAWEGAGFANIQDGVFLGITDAPEFPLILDKFGDLWTGPDHYLAHRDRFGSALAREGIIL